MMDEIYQTQQEQENLSGADLCECWHEEQRRLLDGFDKLRPIIKGEDNEQRRNTECTKTPF